MILKTLISMLRCVWSELELNSAEKWILWTRLEYPCPILTNHASMESLFTQTLTLMSGFVLQGHILKRGEFCRKYDGNYDDNNAGKAWVSLEVVLKCFSCSLSGVTSSRPALIQRVWCGDEPYFSGVLLCFDLSRLVPLLRFRCVGGVCFWPVSSSNHDIILPE